MTWEILYPGTWVIFVIIGIPVYSTVLAWFLGRPRDLGKAMMALTYLVGFITSMWVGVYIFTWVLGIVLPPTM